MKPKEKKKFITKEEEPEQLVNLTLSISYHRIEELEEKNNEIKILVSIGELREVVFSKYTNHVL